jgi:hypothetical protein
MDAELIGNQRAIVVGCGACFELPAFNAVSKEVGLPDKM